MGVRASRLILATLISVTAISCGSDPLSPATRAQIWLAQDRWLTIDGNVRTDDVGRFLSRMRAGGLDAAVFMVPYGDAQGTMARIRKIKAAVEKAPPKAELALTPEEAYRLQIGRSRAVYLGLEIGRATGAAREDLAALHAEGVRFLALSGAGDELGPAGVELIAECERLGVVVDLGGASERAIRAALRASRGPLVVSRAAARAVCDRPGNLSDETIREIAAAGGVVLVSFEPGRVAPEGAERRAAVTDIVDHIEHIVSVAGVDAVGIGSGFGDGGGVADCRDPSDILEVTVDMLRRGFAESTVERIWGGNLMRLFLEADSRAER